MNRSEVVTVRCTGKGGCGRWLLKYDKATGDPVKYNRRRNVSWQPPTETDGAVSPEYWFVMCCGNRYQIPKGFAGHHYNTAE